MFATRNRSLWLNQTQVNVSTGAVCPLGDAFPRVFFIELGCRDNAVLQKQKNINRYVHAYFSDNDEVMMELDGIDLMFSDENLKPIPIKDYREYMKERKKEAKYKAKASKRK